MNHALSIVPVTPIRRLPRHDSEMTSQLLFGEAVELISLHDDWFEVVSVFDGFAGFCPRNQLALVHHDIALQDQVPLVQTWSGIMQVNEAPMHVPLGSALPALLNGEAQWGEYRIRSSSKLIMEGAYPFEDETVRQVAFLFLNAPYLWGGRSVFGLDSNGFVQQVLRFFGKRLPRTVANQSLVGEEVSSLQESCCGDLVFFDQENDQLSHVGLLLNEREVIHVYGKVRIDTIDHMGILNRENFQRMHKLRMIRRLS